MFTISHGCDHVLNWIDNDHACSVEYRLPRKSTIAEKLVQYFSEQREIFLSVSVAFS